MTKGTIFLFAVYCIMLLAGCQPQGGAPEYKAGDPQSLAASLLYEMGGDSLWASRNSLYLRTQMNEKGMSETFVSEEWRDLNAFKLRIEQQGKSFHTIGYFSQPGGWLELVGQDSVYQLTDGELVAWWLDHERNFYRILHRLASGDTELSLESSAPHQLDCLEDGVKLCSFILDEDRRPATFLIWPLDAEEPISMHFSAWGSLPNGMVYPMQGARADSAFSFNMLVWEPAVGIYEAAFEDAPYTWDGLQ